MSERAEIVIVGGGLVGTSTAWNLVEGGFSGRVIVVERDPTYARASSARGMGGVRQQYMSAANVELVRYSVGLWEKTPESGFRQRGYLFLGNESNWDRILRRYEVQKSLGAEVEMLTTAEIRRLVPEVRSDDLMGGVFGPKDGFLEPPLALAHFRRVAESLGVQYIPDEVLGIDTEGDRIAAVHTRSSGKIETRRCLIACGAFSASVAAMAGVRLPVKPVRQHLFRCELPRPWTYEFPMTIDPGGVHWRHSGENEIVIAKTRHDEPEGENLECDEARYHDDFLPDLVRRVPEFAQLKYVRGWAGLYEMTPDHNGIIGAYPGREGLYFACGFSGHGAMMSPATGRVTAEIIQFGAARTVDVSVLAPDRFDRGAFFFDEALI